MECNTGVDCSECDGCESQLEGNFPEFSYEALDIIQFMMHDLSSLKYAYKNTIEGVYEYALHKYPPPQESKEAIIEYVSEWFIEYINE